MEEAKGKALVVIVTEGSRAEQALKRQEEEAMALLDTCGYDTASVVAFNLRAVSSATLIGKGQAEEVAGHVLLFDPDVVYFDTSLSPRVARNLEEMFQKPVMDRNELIIEIFAQRARSREARLQVALAKAEFLLPRLKQKGNTYSQQRGGVRGAKGEGERQIELDRRKLEEEITRLKREIAEVKRQRDTQRKKRLGSGTPSFALVGYTNSGKSSLLKALTGADTFCEDKLFATLDPLGRSLELSQGLSVLLSDTVGFVSNLPHSLIDAFSSTLEESVLADVLIIVMDASSEDVEENLATTEEVLESLGAGGKRTIHVLNKCDLARRNEIAVARIKARRPGAIEVSAKTGLNLDALKTAIRKEAEAVLGVRTFTIPASETGRIERVYREERILAADYSPEGVTFTVKA